MGVDFFLSGWKLRSLLFVGFTFAAPVGATFSFPCWSFRLRQNGVILSYSWMEGLLPNGAISYHSWSELFELLLSEGVYTTPLRSCFATIVTITTPEWISYHFPRSLIWLLLVGVILASLERSSFRYFA